MSTFKTTLPHSLSTLNELACPKDCQTVDALIVRRGDHTLNKAVADYVKWWKITPEEAVDFRKWLSELPLRVRNWNALELQYSWKKFQQNTRIAYNVEQRTDELKATYERIVNELETQGFTLADLEAWKRVFPDGDTCYIFGNQGDASLPNAYRRSTLNEDERESDKENARIVRQKNPTL